MWFVVFCYGSCRNLHKVMTVQGLDLQGASSSPGRWYRRESAKFCPETQWGSNPVLLMSASSCKLVLISKWKASRNVTWFTQLEDPLSKNAFGVRLRLNDQSEYNRLTIMCGLGTHSPAPQSQPRPFWWNTSAHKQKVPLLSLWNKHEGLLGLWS